MVLLLSEIFWAKFSPFYWNPCDWEFCIKVKHFPTQLSKRVQVPHEVLIVTNRTLLALKAITVWAVLGAYWEYVTIELFADKIWLKFNKFTLTLMFGTLCNFAFLTPTCNREEIKSNNIYVFKQLFRFLYSLWCLLITSNTRLQRHESLFRILTLLFTVSKQNSLFMSTTKWTKERILLVG